MDRKTTISIAVIILFIIAGAAYYFYYYSPTGISGILGESKSFEDKKNEVQRLLIGGQLKTLAGEIREVGSDYIIVLVKTPRLEETGKEVRVSVTRDSLMRKISAPVIPEGSMELVPAGEEEIGISDLKAGDRVFVDVKDDGSAAIIDLME